MNSDEVKEINENSVGLTPDQVDYVKELCNKSLAIFEKSKVGSNVSMSLGGFTCPMRVDDIQLLYIGAYLLPNIMNYLVNILPQFLYPYVVSYLQDLSNMRDDPVTINELYHFLIEFNHGNIFDGSETEG